MDSRGTGQACAWRGFRSTLLGGCQSSRKVWWLPLTLHSEFSSSHLCSFCPPFINWIPPCKSLQLPKPQFLHLSNGIIHCTSSQHCENCRRVHRVQEKHSQALPDGWGVGRFALLVSLCCLSCLTHDPGNGRAQLCLTCLSTKTHDLHHLLALCRYPGCASEGHWGTRDGTKGQVRTLLRL